jgi:hypothetical protein
LVSVLLSLSAIAACCASACAAEEAPGVGWHVFGYANPTNMSPGGVGTLVLHVYNDGSVSPAEGPTLVDRLPAGVEATGGEGCTGTTVVTCQVGAVPVGDEVYVLEIPVKVSPSASGEALNHVSIFGGEAPASSNSAFALHFSSAEVGPGVENIEAWASSRDGRIDTQAGSHPYQFVVALALNNRLRGEGLNFPIPAGGETKTIDVKLPPGLIGNPRGVPQCPRAVFDSGVEVGENCPADTQIGQDVPRIGNLGLPTIPLYNIVPPPGVAALFGFGVAGEDTFLEAKVRSGGDDGITVHANNLVELRISFNTTTIWGVPGERSHDYQRKGLGCVEDGTGGCGTGIPAEPFLTLPTSCGAPLRFTAEILGTWTNESVRAQAGYESENEAGEPAGLTGCERLVHFNPTISLAPDTSLGDTPAGLTADLKVPQEVNPEELATSGLRDTTVTLPAGVAINPGQATGLVACQSAEEDIGGEGEAFDGPPSCPAASKVGTDEIATPLLPDKLVGNVYVLQSNPPNLQLLVAASADGVNLKLIGNVHLNEQTGQLTTTFENTPDTPFTEFKLSFSGGAQAALATPTHCGVYESSAQFTPWSTPFVANAFETSTFQITSGPGGSPCVGSLPFSPMLTAGATTDEAGGFTDFSMLLTRGDGQQRIAGLQFKAPEGLTGELSKVPLCTNAQAEANGCPEASKIGHTVVESGPGPYPLTIPEPGQSPAPIYLTEGYEGAPFGLSIVVPLHVGPFTLATQRVRAKIEVDPSTAALTITTGELPQEVAGIPTDLREVDAVIEHSEFMINPTNCEPQSFSGTAYGAPPPGVGEAGKSAAIESHFQVGACRALKFEPQFSATTSGKTSKANGASLAVKLAYPKVPQGTDTDIARVKVELPKVLPSRLTTLQKACTAAQFDANPAGCPAASIVGRAKAITPILPVPLEGPAYFVSHGGEAFPSLILVLQGYGVTIDLVGTTYIGEKTGVTSSTFKTVPDQPITSFELTLPEGKYSALAANGNLCMSKLAMPTEFVGQNGAVIKRSTKIAVSGCAKTKKTTKSSRTRKLAKARRVCERDKSEQKRAKCEMQARERFGRSARKKKK